MSYEEELKAEMTKWSELQNSEGYKSLLEKFDLEIAAKINELSEPPSPKVTELGRAYVAGSLATLKLMKEYVPNIILHLTLEMRKLERKDGRR